MGNSSHQFPRWYEEAGHCTAAATRIRVHSLPTPRDRLALANPISAPHSPLSSSSFPRHLLLISAASSTPASSPNPAPSPTTRHHPRCHPRDPPRPPRTRHLRAKRVTSAPC